MAGMNAGKATITIQALDKTGAVLAAVQQKFKKFAQQITQTGMSMIKTAAAGLVPAALGVKQFSEFDFTMRKVAARAGETVSNIGQLVDQARELGATTAFTARSIGSMQEMLARLGFAPAEIEGMTEAIMNMARAAGTGLDDLEDLRLSADLVGASMLVWKKQTSESTMLSDLFTATVNNSAASLEDLREAFGYAAAVSADAGLSVKQTLQTLGDLHNMWIRGTRAGTTYRRMIVQLTKANQQGKVAIGALGGQLIQIKDTTTGGFLNLNSIVKQIDAATKGLDKVQRMAVFEEIFGVRALTGASGLATASERLSKGLDMAAGSAEKGRKEIEDGIWGALKVTISAVQDLGITVGKVLTEDILPVIENTIVPALNKMSELLAENEGWVRKVAAAFLGLGGVGVLFVGIGIAVKGVTIAIGGLITAIKALKVALVGVVLTAKGLLAVFTTLPGAIIGAGVAAGAVWFKAGKDAVKLYKTLGRIEDIERETIELRQRKARRAVEIPIERAANEAARNAAIAGMTPEEIKRHDTDALSDTINKGLSLANFAAGVPIATVDLNKMKDYEMLVSGLGKIGNLVNKVWTSAPIQRIKDVENLFSTFKGNKSRFTNDVIGRMRDLNLDETQLDRYRQSWRDAQKGIVDTMMSSTDFKGLLTGRENAALGEALKDANIEGFATDDELKDIIAKRLNAIEEEKAEILDPKFKGPTGPAPILEAIQAGTLESAKAIRETMMPVDMGEIDEEQLKELEKQTKALQNVEKKLGEDAVVFGLEGT